MLYNPILNNIDISIIERVPDYNMLAICIASLVVFILLLSVKVFFKEYYKDLFYVILRPDNSGKIYIENNITYIQATIIVQISSIITVATAIFAIIVYLPGSFISEKIEIFRDTFNNKPIEILFLYLRLMLIIVVYLIYRWFATCFVGWVFGFNKVTEVYFDFNLNLIKILGIILFPVCLLLPFAYDTANKILIICILIFFILVFIYKSVIFFLNSIKIKFFNHYSILYFCTFEILPILFLIKVITE